MKASILFSGGKDSSLSAILMEPFFDVELVTCTFSTIPTGEIAKKAADELGFKHRILNLDKSILEDAFKLIVEDGYPKNAINHIHQKAIETLASDPDVEIIADGIRRDDRVPLLNISQIRSIEDRFKVHYACPLRGYGRSAVNKMVEQHLQIEEGQSEHIIKADYETELREIIRQRIGDEKVKEIFPSHVQSQIVKRIK